MLEFAVLGNYQEEENNGNHVAKDEGFADLPPTQPIMGCILLGRGTTFQQCFKDPEHPPVRGSFKDS